MKKIYLLITIFTTLLASSSIGEKYTSSSPIDFQTGIRNSGGPINALFNGDSQNGAVSPTPNPTYPTDPGDSGDMSTSFEDAIELYFKDSYGEYFQSTSDIDYYVYYAEYTNYIKFNIESLNSTYDCLIRVYNGTNLNKVIMEYDNIDTRTGSNIDLIDSIYAYQGETYYFEVSLISDSSSSGVSPLVINVGYSAKLLSGNEADCDPSEFKSKGYIYQDSVQYRDMSNIRFYYTDNLNKVVAGPNTYIDAIVEAMERWNTVGPIHFNLESVDDANDADIVFDVYEIEHKNAGRTYIQDPEQNSTYNKTYIVFNKYVFEELIDYQQLNEYSQELYLLNVALHEIGHSLNLDHINYNQENIMYKDVIRRIQFGTADIAVYRYLWG